MFTNHFLLIVPKAQNLTVWWSGITVNNSSGITPIEWCHIVSKCFYIWCCSLNVFIFDAVVLRKSRMDVFRPTVNAWHFELQISLWWWRIVKILWIRRRSSLTTQRPDRWGITVEHCATRSNREQTHRLNYKQECDVLP